MQVGGTRAAQRDPDSLGTAFLSILGRVNDEHSFRRGPGTSHV